MLAKRFCLIGAITVFLMVALSCASEAASPAEMARLRNMGRAYYEEEKYEDSLKVFGRCLKLTPDSAMDEINLGMVLVELGRFEEARKRLGRGEKLDASLAPYATYNRAVIYKREKRFPEAAKEFEKMRQLDPKCPDTAYNLAVVYETLGELEKAFGELSRAVSLAPDMIAPHYRRMIIAMRLGKKDIAIEERGIFAELRAADSRTRTAQELERSMYTEIIEPERTGPVPTVPVVKNPLGVKFEDATADAGLLSETKAEPFLAIEPVCLGDIDADGRIDLLILRGSFGEPPELMRNRGEGRFERVSAAAGLLKLKTPPLAAAFGDLDHDGDDDLCLSEPGVVHLLLNQGGGKLAPATQQLSFDSGIKPRELLLVDFDHEGDLDLYVAFKSRAPIMFRNDGKGGFTPVPTESGLSGNGAPASRLCFIDIDDDNDVDFFLTQAEGENRLLSSMRMGSFIDVAERLGVQSPMTPRNVTVTDINNDAWPDILFLQEDGRLVAKLGTRSGAFKTQELGNIGKGGRALAILDYDNDGDEDVFASGRLLQNDGTFTDVTDEVGLEIARPQSLLQAVAEDFDGDGDFDLALAWEDGRVALLRNQGGNRNHWIRANLEGLQSNRFGVSTKVEVRDGAFFQRRICMGRPMLLGVGERESLDVLRLWWPTGVAQNILSPKVGDTVDVREKLGPPSSCPFVYTWDGEKFSFLTDVLDGAPLGVPLGDGGFLPYRSKEDLLIPGSRIRSKDGQLVIQLTGELRELVYVDRATLTAVDHASDTSVFPDDCVGPPGSGTTRLYDVKGLRPPISAADDRGEDVTGALLDTDGQYARGFDLTRFHGLAEKHTVMLEFDGVSRMKQPVLILTGWIEWIDGDTLYALGQGAGPVPFGPALDVQTADGHWERVSDNIGVPAGIGKNVVAELPPRLCGMNTLIRIVTNLEVYWDRIMIGDAAGQSEITARPLTLTGANLHFRGFSEVMRGQRGEPPWYDYGNVTTEAPYQPQRGLLTRYGDVLPLLTTSDDRLTVFGPGDELTLVFAVPPELASGQERDFILRLDGWIKDANPSTFTGDQVDPLPYRAMRGYPFGAEEGIVDDPSYAEYLSQYNTRSLRRDEATLGWSAED